MVEGLIYFSLFSFWLDVCAGFQLEKLFGLAMGLSLQNISLYLLILVWALTINTRDTLFQQNNINRYMFILVIFVTVSIIPNIIVGYGGYKASLKQEIVQLKRLLNPWLYFFLITSLISDKKTCERIISALILLLVASVFAMLIQNFLGINLGTHVKGKSYIGRSAGFAAPNEYAAFLVLFLPLFLSPIFLKERQSVRIKGFFLFFVGLIGLFSTVSKGGFIAFFISMVCFFFYVYRKRLITKMRIFIILYLLLATGFASFLLLPSQTREIAVARLTLQKVGPYDPWAIRKFSFLHKLTSGRTELWLYSLKVITQKPILGYGKSLASIYTPKSTHNEYLGWLVNYGIIGFLFFSMVYIKIFNHIKYHLKTSTNLKSRILYLGYMCGFIGYVTAMIGACLVEPRMIFWIYTAIIYKYIELDAAQDKQDCLDINNANSVKNYTYDVPNTIRR